MTDWGVGSSLRRLFAPTGALVVLGLVFAVSAVAAGPAPDPPPLPAPPKAEPVQPTVTVVVRQAPVATPAPVVTHSTPVAKAPAQRAKPKPTPAKVKRVVKPKAAVPAPVVRPPHDRNRVPLAAFVPTPAVDSVDRGLLALAGFGLLLVALGGAVALVAARRQLKLALLGTLAVLAVLPAAGQAAPYAPLPTCSPGPADCSAWHTGDVSISWQYESGWTAITCNSLPVLTDTGGVDRTCSVSYGPGGTDTYARTVTVRRDATAPQVNSATPSRPPDSGGWYRQPLSVAFAGADATSGIASCTSPTYGGGDGASVAVSGSCTDVAGNTSGATFGFKYDATPPAITPSPDRKPDGKGWYRKPLTVSFAGTDVTSGIASCTAPTRYAGPDLAKAAVVGSCRDGAGNLAEVGHAFQYDATAPKLPMAKAEVEQGVAKIVWKRSADAVLVELERTPGINGRKKTVVYRGKGASFTDKTVRDGVRYRYEIRASDVAGNTVQRAVTADVDLPALYRPTAGAAVRAPLVLAWDVVKGATFYNVQLYRNKVKVLTFWPKSPTFRIGKTWRYAGKLQRLVPGRYDWYVWGAQGTREKPQYGKLLGSNTFVVK